MFLDIAFANDYQAPALMPECESKLSVVKATFGKSKSSGGDMITLILKPLNAAEHGVENPQNIFNYLSFPNGLDADNDNFFRGNMTAFCEAFGCEITSRLEADDTTGEIPSWVGKEGWAALTVEPDEGYGPKNGVQKFTRSA